MTKDQLLNLLREAGRLEVDRLLSSDKAFDKFLRDNPLTKREQAQVKRSVAKLRKKFLHSSAERSNGQ